MSRIGKLPISFWSEVAIEVNGDRVRVNGPKGRLEESRVQFTRIEVQDGEACVLREGDEKAMRAAHGLMRSLLQNMVTGVTEGFKKDLEILGVGYRAELKGGDLVLSVGYSHPVKMKIEDGLEVVLRSPTQLEVRGIDKQRVGQFAAEIRKVRPPEPYKGKGIRYLGEYVRRKVGKSGATAGVGRA